MNTVKKRKHIGQKYFSDEERTIGLISDFGLKDNFVGVIKGVILSINPKVKKEYIFSNMVKICQYCRVKNFIFRKE